MKAFSERNPFIPCMDCKMIANKFTDRNIIDLISFQTFYCWHPISIFTVITRSPFKMSLKKKPTDLPKPMRFQPKPKIKFLLQRNDLPFFSPFKPLLENMFDLLNHIRYSRFLFFTSVKTSLYNSIKFRIFFSKIIFIHRLLFNFNCFSDPLREKMIPFSIKCGKTGI